MPYQLPVVRRNRTTTEGTVCSRIPSKMEVVSALVRWNSSRNTQYGSCSKMHLMRITSCLSWFVNSFVLRMRTALLPLLLCRLPFENIALYDSRKLSMTCNTYISMISNTNIYLTFECWPLPRPAFVLCKVRCSDICARDKGKPDYS